MSGWAIWWYIIVSAAVLSYFGLAIILSIGGFFDVKKMFQRLTSEHAQAAAQTDNETTNLETRKTEGGDT